VIMSEIDASLGQLAMNHVDLYRSMAGDHETPIEETFEALHDIVRARKARYIGAALCSRADRRQQDVASRKGAS